MKVSLNSNILTLKSFSKPKFNTSVVKQDKISLPAKALGYTTASCLAGQVLVNRASATKSLSDAQFNSYLKKNNYIYSEENVAYIKNYSDEEKHQILNSKDGHDNQKIGLLLGKRISKEEMSGFREFLNLSNGNALQNIDDNFDNLMVSYLTLKRNGLFENHKNLSNKNSAYQNLVLNSATKPISVYTRNVLMGYKLEGSKAINEYYRNGCPEFSQETAKKANEIANYIDSQQISQAIKTYRIDNLKALNNVKLSDGSNLNLGKKLFYIQNIKDTETQQKEVQSLQELLLDNEISVNQPAFLSTSLDKNIQKNFEGDGNILWELDVPKGTKGTYLEPLNLSNILSIENEFLIQKNSDIIIKGINFNRENHQWIINAEIKQ